MRRHRPTPWLHPTRGAELYVGSALAGVASLLHPRAARALELRRPAAVAELDLDVLLAHGEAPVRHAPLPRFPAVPYDLAFEVSRVIPTASVAAAIREGARAGAALVREVTWLSSFVLDDERRSDAYHLVFRADDRSLTTEEVSAHTAAIVAHLQEALGATLRG